MKSKQKTGRRRFIRNSALTATSLSVPIVLSNKMYGVNNNIQEGNVRDFYKTSKSVNYKCLFNHELLIVTNQKENSTQYIQSFVEKLKDTDVDAVMCCPTAWRANLFPSEVDQTWKEYSPDWPLSKFPSFDYIMRYLHSGGDPVKDTLEACRKYEKGFFISYRMNDWHHLNDLAWPTHNDFWRDNPQYWFGKSEDTYEFDDRSRLLNYIHPEVRDHYFSIIRELCTNYDVDGVELDFQRAPKCIKSTEIKKGTAIMTAFVKRIRQMMEKIGNERDKTLNLCVRLPHNLELCSEFGFDVRGWDAEGLVDMINVSSSYINTLEIGIEEFKEVTGHAKIYGEMHFITENYATAQGLAARRFTTPETYRATAYNFLYRGADGLSLFNFDYIIDPNGWEDTRIAGPGANDIKKMRTTMAETLKNITNVSYLKTVSKNYVINSKFENLLAKNENTVHLVIPDDTNNVKFDRAVLRVELRPWLHHESSNNTESLHYGSLKNIKIGVWFNGIKLDSYLHKGDELFKPIIINEAYPRHETLRFYIVPLEKIISGENEVVIRNIDRETVSCEFNSLEIALYR